jgi:PAS domain S-box-containing protein
LEDLTAAVPITPDYDFARLIAENATDLISILDQSGVFLYVSPSHHLILGYSPDELVGSHYEPLVHPADLADAKKAVVAQASRPTVVRVKHADGSWMYIEGVISTFAEGGQSLILSVARDVTDREKSRLEVERLDQTLSEYIEELETMINTVPVGIIITRDPEGKKIDANEAFAVMLGLPPGIRQYQLGNVSFKVLEHGKEVPLDNMPLRQTIKSGKPVLQRELDILRRDGTVVSIYGAARPLFGADGRVRGAIAAFLDVTAKRIDELRIKEANRRITGILEGILNHETETQN